MPFWAGVPNEKRVPDSHFIVCILIRANTAPQDVPSLVNELIVQDRKVGLRRERALARPARRRRSGRAGHTNLRVGLRLACNRDRLLALLLGLNRSTFGSVRIEHVRMATLLVAGMPAPRVLPAGRSLARTLEGLGLLTQATRFGVLRRTDRGWAPADLSVPVRAGDEFRLGTAAPTARSGEALADWVRSLLTQLTPRSRRAPPRR